MNHKAKVIYYLFLVFFLCFIFFIIEEKLNPSVLINVDEKLWMYRSQIYIDNALNFNFVGGLQTIHPGITVMSLSGILLYVYSFYASTINEPMLLYVFNIPIVSYIFFFFFFLYFLLRELKFDKALSFLIIILISSNSYYIISSSPVDKFSVMSILLSLLFLIVYTNHNYRFKKYLLLSSFFASFAILSKLSSLILIPFSLFILLYYSKLNTNKIRGAINDYFYYLFYLVVTSCIIFPGFIFRPILSVQKIIGAGNNILISGVDSDRGEIYIPSLFEKIYKYSFILESSIIAPFTLVFFVLFLIFCFRKMIAVGLSSKFTKENIFYKNIFILFIFAIVYLVFINYFASRIFYRYMILFAMIIDICAAIGIYKILLLCKERLTLKSTIDNLTIKFIIIFFIFKVMNLIMLSKFVQPIVY